MPRDPFGGYDNWLERPYAEAARRAERLECPVCGVTMDENKLDREVECPACGYYDGFDWDAEAERRAEARMDEMEDRDEW